MTAVKLVHVLLSVANLVGVRLYLTVLFICVSPITNEVEQFFYSLLTISLFSFVNFISISFA